MKRNPLVIGGVAVLALVAILFVAGDPGWSSRPVSPAETARMLELMFPGSTFRAASENSYIDIEGRTVLIDHVDKGSFTRAGANEILLVASRSRDEFSHAQGLYHSYAAVFDRKAVLPVSAVADFSADEGQMSVFRGRNLDYVLFIGSNAFQGWEEWTGGLWKAGYEWIMVWPEDSEFWKDTAVVVEDGLLKVMSREVTSRPGQLIPDYRFKPAYLLKWNSQEETFGRVP